MTTFSANLGLLWNDIPLADAIHRAAAAGFAAVECHWPYDQPHAEVARALRDTQLPMLSINTRPGAAGEAGHAAIPGREIEARLAIDEALNYASKIAAESIHVLAGITPQTTDGFLAFFANLRYACTKAADHDIQVLIEPLNAVDTPGYYLQTVDDAIGVIEAVDRPNLRLLFDCYHAQITEPAVFDRLDEIVATIGHVQLASVPGRSEPNRGTPNYSELFNRLHQLGWTRPIGAEYRPSGATPEDTLGWMTQLS